MSYFRERNKLRSEYSGYQEATPGLRERFAAICKHYIAEGHIGVGNDGWYIPARVLNHEIKLNLNKKDIYSVILSGSYDEVFEAVEIFLSVAKGYYTYKDIASEVVEVFQIAGSVYTISAYQVTLRIEEKLAQDLQVAKGALSQTRSGCERFLQAVGGLISREVAPEDAVNGVFIAFEDYLKEKTSEKDYKDSVKKLEKESVLSPTQKAILEKIFAYRSDTYGVAHAGNSEKPTEIDALWFVETVTAQLIFLDRKFKQHE